MYGLVQVTQQGVTGSQECIAALDLRDGGTQVCNVTLDRASRNKTRVGEKFR